MSRITDAKRAQDAITALHDDSEPRDADSISVRSRHTLRAFGADTEGDEEDPWSAIPRPLPNSPAVIASGAVLTTAQRKQLLLRALLQLLALFVVCLVGLGGTLWLALPVIAPEDKPNFKLPRSFDELKNLNTVLQHYKSEHFFRVLLCWVIVYMFLQAFSIPGSMYMSILAGALFGVPIALPLVCASVATGATICYLISKFLGVVLVALPSWQKRVDDWKEKLAEHNDNMLSYLIVIRMMPLPPHNIVNILAPHLGISIPLFWLSTFCGIFAVSVIHTTIGEKLDQMTSPDDFNLFSLRNVLLLAGVCIAVLIPVFIRKFSKVESLEEGEESGHGAVYLDENEAGEEDAPRLPDSFRPNLVGLQREEDSDEDELPRRNLDTHNIVAATNTFQGNAEGEESFPSWRDNRSLDEEYDDDQLDAEQGRGGVFTDRAYNNGAARAKGGASTRGKLKAWIGSNTGIQL